MDDTMTYYQRMNLFNERFTLDADEIPVEELGQRILIRGFHSTAHNYLPDEQAHIADKPTFKFLMNFYLSQSKAANKEIFHSLQTLDKEIATNNIFRYPIIVPDEISNDRVIFLFHGLNERFWNKYLPWASTLAERTGSAVVLFPIAFHMNRSPESWSDIRRMMPVSRERRSMLPDVQCSSFANTALSYRIQFAPQRFEISGIQTFNDVAALMHQLKDGKISGIPEASGFDFFGYSIGATLTETLMMADPDGLTADSRAFLFCGGAALDLSTPIHKAIVDDYAFDSLLQHFHSIHASRAVEVKDLESGDSSETFGYLKHLMLFDKMEHERDTRLHSLKDRIKVIALEQDSVMNPMAMKKTFSTSGVSLEFLDYPYPHSHEHPFPLKPYVSEEVEDSFEHLMSTAVSFFR